MPRYKSQDDGAKAKKKKWPWIVAVAGVAVVAGVTALGNRAVAGAMLLLGDEPGLDSDHIRTVRELAESGSPVSLRAQYRDRPGHPVYLPEEVLRSIPHPRKSELL